MLYTSYQAHSDLTNPFRKFARYARDWLAELPPSALNLPPLRHLSAAYDLIAETGLTHKRPDFQIAPVTVGGKIFQVTEHASLVTPFCTLMHFRKEGGPQQPRLMLVSPMSSHFATLLRETIQCLLVDHDVYVTDWHNIRDVPRSAGRFDLDDYIDHLMRFLKHMGPDSHVLSICQPCPAALAAVALLAEDGDAATPRSLTLMAGPVDARVSPSALNKRAEKRSMGLMQHAVITRVPMRYAGAGRRVYPGFLQLSAFMSMNLGRHQKSFRDMYKARAAGDHAKAETIRKFYSEYFAVADLSAPFYLQTVRTVFREHHMPLGRFMWRGRKVNLGAINRTALLTVEAGRDDMCGLGQTQAALGLCPNIPADMKFHHVEAEVGHYGVFAGRHWRESICPRIGEHVRRYAAG